MSASALTSKTETQAEVGLRRINIRKDLAPVADLLELAFGNTLDANGHNMLREMRTLSRSGPILWAMAGLDKMLKGLMQGYVWVEDGQIIGNISLYPAAYDNTWVIANVAVHPDYRRQGIARALMNGGLTDLQQRGASKVVLQVEASNIGAQALYESLKFRALRGFTRWRRRPYTTPPAPLANMPAIRLRRRKDWQDQLALAEEVRPNNQGGLGWLRPTEKSEFKQSSLSGFLTIFSMDNVLHWVIRDEVNRQLLGTAIAQMSFGKSYTRIDALIHPAAQGQLERPLLNYLVRFMYERGRGIYIQHPSDDYAMRSVLRDYEFEVTHQLVHMEWLPQ